MMTPQEKFAFLQEILPKIDIYLIKDLAKEKLSERVEKERQHYVKILESLLPPAKHWPAKTTEQNKRSSDDSKSEYVILTNQQEQDPYEDVCGGVGFNNRFQSNTQLPQSDRSNSSDKQPTGQANTKGSTSSNDGGYYDVSELRMRTSDASQHSEVACSAEDANQKDPDDDDQVDTAHSDDTTKDRGHAGKLVKKAWKGFLAQGSSLITSASGTLTRRKKMKESKSSTDTIEPPDSVVAAKLEVCLHFMEPSKSWSIKYVVVQNGYLNIYRSSHDERAECSLMLPGTTLLPVEDKVCKRQLTIRLWHPEEQKDICLDFGDRKMEHGRWFDILVKQVKFRAPVGYTKPNSEQPVAQSEYEDLPDEETLAERLAMTSPSMSTGHNSEEYENVFMDRSKRPLPAAPSSPGDDEQAGSAPPGPSLVKVRTTPIMTQKGSCPAMSGSLSGNALTESQSKAMTLPRNMPDSSTGTDVNSTRKRFDDSKWKPSGSSTSLSTTNKTDPTVTKSGQLNVSVNYSTPLKSFYNRFCVIKDGNFIVYENQRDTKVICSIGLAGADVSEAQKVIDKHLIIKTRQDNRTQEICIKFSTRKEDQVEMKQWSEIIKEQSCAGSRDTYLSARMPNDDRADQPPPPLPACPPPDDEFYCNQDQLSTDPAPSVYELDDVATTRQQKQPTSTLRTGGPQASTSARSTAKDGHEVNWLPSNRVQNLSKMFQPN